MCKRNVATWLKEVFEPHPDDFDPCWLRRDWSECSAMPTCMRWSPCWTATSFHPVRRCRCPVSPQFDHFFESRFFCASWKRAIGQCLLCYCYQPLLNSTLFHFFPRHSNDWWSLIRHTRTHCQSLLSARDPDRQVTDEFRPWIRCVLMNILTRFEITKITLLTSLIKL